MRGSKPQIAGAPAASAEQGVLSRGALVAAFLGETRGGGSSIGQGWRILRAITQEQEEKEWRGDGPLADRLFSARFSGGVGPDDRVPEAMESADLNLRTKSLWLVGAIAAAVLAIALLLVGRLVAVADDPLLARQIGWNLLFIALSAGILAAGAAFWVVRRITLPLQRLARTISGMARTGQLQNDFPTAGGGSEVQLIEETFRSLAVSLEESQRARERSYVEAVGAVVTAADARDHETSGHSFRVALYAVALAKAMGLHGEPLKAIEWGALLHDVGKMVVPDEILRKMGPLTEQEWHIMKQHPTWGFDMLAEVSFLQPAALEIIYSHHERWDGQGYPRGIAAESIPLSARIFAVVDTYDAITSDRPYRRARPHQVAVNELQRVAGQQLDPAVVEVFRELPEVDLRRLRELCKRVHPGLSLPADLLDSLAEPETKADFGS
jgi:putative nucleotidyltransferase with HDIG domain